MNNKSYTYDLVFSKQLNNKSPINLVFGDDSTDPVSREHIASATVDLYEFSLLDNVYIDYGIDHNRISSNLNIIINKAASAYNLYAVLLNESFKLDRSFMSNFGISRLNNYQLSITWGSTDKFKSRFIVAWSRSRYIRSDDIEFSVKNSYLSASRFLALWCSADYLFYSRNVFFGGSFQRIKENSINILSAENVGKEYDVLWNIANNFTNNKNIFWNIADLPSGCGPSIRPPIIPPKPPNPDGIIIRRDLIFCKKPNNKNPINLVFGDVCDGGNGDYSIPEKGVYIVQNNVDIFRTDSGEKIKAFSVDIGANDKEYLWSGNLSLPFSELSKVIDNPEIEININQLKFIVDIDSISNNQEFNSKLIDISVVSTTNRLKTINAHKFDLDASSIAIMSAQLSRDDLETGFIFKQESAVSWIIPANLIEYDEASSLDIINQIALTSGDSVISHAHKKEISIRSKYQSGDAVYRLPIGKLLSYSADESESTKYNAIVVTAENNGITATVRKDGTAGDKIAPMLVNKLISDQSIARRAAINAIYNTDDKKVSISTESILFKETPMIYPRDVVSIGSDVGFVEDIRISAEISNNAAVIRHTMTIEKKML